MAELKIENQAMMFAFLSRAAIEAKGEEGRAAIQDGMIRYGRERGARMAERARKAGDPVDLWTNQAYGEWKPDYAGQMEFGMLRSEPTYQTYIAKCAWCEAWKKNDILEFGREYCVNVDAAVYEGFGCGAVCTPISTSMSWGGDRCDFDWGKPLSTEEVKMVSDKKAELGTSAMRDFNFHTAHIYCSVADELCKHFMPNEITTDSFITARNIEVCEILPVNEKPRAERIADGEGLTYRMACNTTGRIEMDVVCEEDTEIVMTYDEFLGENGLVNFRRLYTVNSLVWRLRRGTHHISTFEPYVLGAAHVFVTKGAAEISEFRIVYFGADDTQRSYNGDDDTLHKIFHAAVETYRQNTFTIYMDCPSRERAGWLCDSFFTARVEKVLTGKSEIEHSFLENFFIPDSTPRVPEGMFPMCYPADHYNGNYISNWAMWLVLELEEYYERTGDRALIDNAKPYVYDLVDYFTKYENADGILEKLGAWVFVEWSRANYLTAGVNFPSNMLYAACLEAMSEMYDDPALGAQAQAMRETIRRLSFNGQFFVDQMLRDESGKLYLQGEVTEVCQYYAFYCGTATKELYPQLWNTLLYDFGPWRKENNKYPEVHFANAFIGNYLRLDMMAKNDNMKEVLDNIEGYFYNMALTTCTLWENDSTVASLDHGFASHVIVWLLRDMIENNR
jgi:hypothetical protein